MPETVPADIAAAMDAWMDAHHDLLRVKPHSAAYDACLAARAEARDALEAAILAHVPKTDWSVNWRAKFAAAFHAAEARREPKL